MSEKAERLDVRLTEEEKARLAELAKQRGISMADLVRTWIVRGDVVHVFAEQLEDFITDFGKWHVSENRSTNLSHLCNNLRGRMGAIENVSMRNITFKWIEFFVRSFRLMENDVSDLRKGLSKFVKQKKPKDKEELIVFISKFTLTVNNYHNIFVQGFIDILQNMDKEAKRSFGRTYNDEFRTRYNEITSKFEDFLKRAQRELGVGLERAMSRAGEFRPKE